MYSRVTCTGALEREVSLSRVSLMDNALLYKLTEREEGERDSLSPHKGDLVHMEAMIVLIRKGSTEHTN